MSHRRGPRLVRPAAPRDPGEVGSHPAPDAGARGRPPADPAGAPPVLIVHSYGMEGSGSSTYTRGLAAGLVAAGYRVVVAGHRAPGDEGAIARLRGRGCVFEPLPREALAVTYERAELPGAPLIRDLPHVELVAKRDRLAGRIGQLARAYRPSLIIANHFLLGASAATRAAHALGIPVAVVSHGTDIEYAAARSDTVRSLARETFARAHGRIALTGGAAARIADVLEVDARALALVPPGICEGCCQSFAGPRRPRVAFVGRLLLDKGPHLALAALVRVPDIELCLIGDGPDRGGLEQLVAALDRGDEVATRRVLADMGTTPERRAMVEPALSALFGGNGSSRQALVGGLARRVEFCGYVSTSEVGRMLADARLVVLPSMVPECFPLVLLEGMSMGCAIAATPLGGTADLLSEVTAALPAITEFARIDPSDPVTGLAHAMAGGVRTWREPAAARLSTFAKSRYLWPAIGTRVVAACTVSEHSIGSGERRGAPACTPRLGKRRATPGGG